MPQLATQTHLGIFNPRLNPVSRLAVAEIPTDVIEIVRSEVIWVCVVTRSGDSSRIENEPHGQKTV